LTLYGPSDFVESGIESGGENASSPKPPAWRLVNGQLEWVAEHLRKPHVSIAPSGVCFAALFL